MNVPPGVPPDLFFAVKSAGEAREKRDYKTAFELLEATKKKYPNAVPLLMELGLLHGKRYDYATAKKYLDEGIKEAGYNPRAIFIAGMHCNDFGNVRLARDYFAKTVSKTDPPFEALARLASLQERQNLHDEATVTVERALKLRPGDPAIELIRARLERHRGNFENAERILFSILAKSVDNLSFVPRVWYDLGNLLDRMKRYDEAMNAWMRAKTLIQPHAIRVQDKLKLSRERVLLTQTEVTEEVAARWEKMGEELQPYRRLTVLTGHPRSGTTLLEQVLDAHPDVISADENLIFNDEVMTRTMQKTDELHSFQKILDALSTEDCHQLRADYFKFTEAFVGEPVNGRMLVEKNPALGGGTPFMMRIFPEAKFLLAIRDPRDVCLSCFMQWLPLNPISSSFLTLAGTVEEYISTMTAWKALLPRMKNPHLLVRYEDVVEDLEPEARRVFEFLGIPWDERVLKFHERTREKIVRSPTYSDVAKPIFKTARGRWRNYEKYITPYAQKLAPFLKDFGYE